MKPIRVYVSKQADRRFYYMEWVDHAGKKRHKSTEQTSRKEATRVALDHEAFLNKTDKPKDGTMSMLDLYIDYELNIGSQIRKSSMNKIRTAVNHTIEIIKPDSLLDINRFKLAAMASKLQELGKSPSSAKSIMGSL